MPLFNLIICQNNVVISDEQNEDKLLREKSHFLFECISLTQIINRYFLSSFFLNQHNKFHKLLVLPNNEQIRTYFNSSFRWASSDEPKFSLMAV